MQRRYERAQKLRAIKLLEFEHKVNFDCDLHSDTEEMLENRDLHLDFLAHIPLQC